MLGSPHNTGSFNQNCQWSSYCSIQWILFNTYLDRTQQNLTLTGKILSTRLLLVPCSPVPSSQAKTSLSVLPTLLILEVLMSFEAHISSLLALETLSEHYYIFDYSICARDLINIFSGLVLSSEPLAHSRWLINAHGINERMKDKHFRNV